MPDPTRDLQRICLVLPTDRACEEMIAAIGAEAHHAADHFDAEVHLLILDSADEHAYAVHAAMLNGMSRSPRVIVHHADEAAQRDFLRRVIRAAGPAKPDLVLDLMLPGGVSYGACTNRAFLYASALGCESIHRRDSDSRYQTARGRPVFPIHHELATVGRRAIEAVDEVSETDWKLLDPAYAHRPVALVGGSFVGELSVDLGEIHELDRDAYRELVGLRAPGHWTPERRRALVEESLRGAGSEPFVRDHSVLTVVDPMRVGMCNVAFHHEVYERVPLPPALDTIGSDYFLMHLIQSAGLPGVLHNRDIVNFYTTERRTDAGFPAYQLRFAKSLLSMLYLNFIYGRMEEAGSSLLDASDHVRPDAVAELARLSAGLDRAENVERLRVIDGCYRGLGGRYAEFAVLLAERGPRLLDEAQADIEDFALLTELWQGLVQASKSTDIGPVGRPGAPGRRR
ncbi:MAG TPA: DUF6271 family protein [Actinocrinis sp.]|uniref:DUF6271 family protein n=1 Tax=Actinocrinis sp. TaxID=1920516 RepID=UPI002DDCCC7C|nr:DUF6271 family protein [Actinocrinis sp.]HEV2342869.1 DUF6271 family protein [Actinocrinis sp.]